MVQIKVAPVVKSKTLLFFDQNGCTFILEDSLIRNLQRDLINEDVLRAAGECIKISSQQAYSTVVDLKNCFGYVSFTKAEFLDKRTDKATFTIRKDENSWSRVVNIPTFRTKKLALHFVRLDRGKYKLIGAYWTIGGIANLNPLSERTADFWQTHAWIASPKSDEYTQNDTILNIARSNAEV